MLKGIKNKIKQNKIGKLLMAGILSAVVTLTALPITVKADDPVFDPDITTGSITIHKYEYNGTNKGTGTGAEGDNVPTDATPLNGVTFKITKVATLDDYYKYDGIALPTTAPSVDSSKLEEDTDNQLEKVGEYRTGVTGVNGTDGEIEFSGLSLGIYLVQETDAPSQITGKENDFIVSIPMTNATGTGWLYDVHVYPKNSSAYGEVTLKKYGKVGDDAESELSGATFVLQRQVTLTDASGNSTTSWETVDIKDDAGTAITLTTADTTDATAGTTKGEITVKNLAPATYRFVETSAPSGYIMDGVTAYEFTVEKDSNGVISVDFGNTDTEGNKIKVTNYQPDLVKQVKNSAGTWANAADYSIGDTIPYLITLDIPSNVASLQTFTIKDELPQTGMKYVSGSLKIYDTFSNNTLSGDKTSDFTITQPSDANSTWQITLNKANNANIEKYAGAKLYIYYEAQLTDDAVNASTGNINTATLTYSHEIIPTQANDPQNPNVNLSTSTTTIFDQAVVYTFRITVTKVDGSDTSKKLANVKFDLYKQLTADTTTTPPVKGLPKGTYTKINDTRNSGNAYTTDSNGVISVNGLEAGTYYLVETETVADATGKRYNLLKNPIEISLTYSRTENADGTVSITTYPGDNQDGIFKQTVKNYTGFTLPATGGVGTVVFVFVGVSMMVAAVILFVISRKKNREEK